MKYEWDDRKNERNTHVHGINFLDACRIFDLPVFTQSYQKDDDGEDRRIAIGWMDASLITVVFVQRGMETIGIISALAASRFDEQIYGQNVGYGLHERGGYERSTE
jgi:uncharacterized DUF497 family protein